MIAGNPEVLSAALGQFGALMFGGRLDPALKEVAFVVVSQEHECAYCAATHGSALVNAFGLPEATLQALARRDDAALTDRQRAVARFARQVANDPKGVGAEHFEALGDVGLDTAELIELVAVVAQSCFANTIADATGMTPGDESPDLDRYYPLPTRATGAP